MVGWRPAGSEWLSASKRMGNLFHKHQRADKAAWLRLNEYLLGSWRGRLDGTADSSPFSESDYEDHSGPTGSLTTLTK